MIVGLGMDLVERERIARAVERFGERFFDRILTPAERAAAPTASGPLILYTAARFAAKEAASKALGTGFALGIGPRDIETLTLPSGRPQLRLGGAAAQRARELGVASLHVSLSHERGMACAVVVLEG